MKVLALALPILLVDSMIVIEAVRTGCWNAISGQHRLATVRTCAEELSRGNPADPHYVTVSATDLARIAVEEVSGIVSARFRLLYQDADGMDAGERDLMAHALDRKDEFRVCSCDKAYLRAAHALGWIERVRSLEAIASACGARPNPPFRKQFTEAQLSEWRTKLFLGVRI